MDANSQMSDELDLLNRLLQDDGIFLEKDELTIPRAKPGPSPASFEQRRLWFLHELAPSSAAYNVSSSFHLDGRLDLSALSFALEAMTRRHEILRASFREIDGQPRQFVADHIELPLRVLDWRGREERETQSMLSALALEEAHYSFDLKQPPLFRVTLVRSGEQRQTLFLTFHHIITDAWSIGVFVEEFTTLYSAHLAGAADPLPPLRIQYSDYAAWQVENTTEESIDRQLAYWGRRLADLPVLDFPTDFPRPKLQTFRGGLVPFRVPAALSAALVQFSRRQQHTLFTTLMAAFQVLLARYARQREVIVGTSFANRADQDTQRLIGFFVNMMTLRADLSPAQSFLSVLERTGELILEAFEHSSLPYERLVEKLAPARDMSRNPLFQVAFTLLNVPAPRLALDGLKITPFANQDAARFDFEFFVREEADGLSGAISFNTDLFLPRTMERLAGSYLNLLASIVEAPDLPISRLSLLAEAELEELSARGPRQAFPVAECLHESFERQARLWPERVALKFDGREMSYRELNRRANCVARQLVEKGVGADVLVGLLAEPSFEMLVGILGILKAGGAYVPLDPAYPPERFSYMINDCRVALVLATGASGRLLDGCAVETLRLEDLLERIDDVDCGNPARAVAPSNLAYVIYTSGSTGRPKGALVTHANVGRLMTAAETCFSFDEQDTWTLFHSFAFDFSVWEIWGALLYGGRLLIVPRMVRRSPEDFYNLLCDEKVTVLNQTPSAFRQLMQAEERLAREAEIALRYVVFGGEALELSHLDAWVERHGDESPQLVNMYGITETTVHVTFRRIELRDVKCPSGSVIGLPLPDLEIYLLDEHLRPVPPGAVGEIFVAGAGVARGYLRRPALTAERFVPNPFGGERGARLYRSGDLARALHGGGFEYLGRGDEQLKVRGHRIEPAEIEAALAEHPAVQQVLVVPAEARAHERLLAYVVPRMGRDFDALAEGWQREQVGQWNTTFDEIYGEGQADGDETFNLSGWTSSYDGRPIPAGEMREWLAQTVSLVEELRPREVLEIGCGTGMLLFRLAAQAERYVATDFSRVALERLGRQVGARGWNHVRLLERRADDFTNLPPSSFDTVVINSVIQYFPSGEYLLDVLGRAIRVAKPSGVIVVGDVRSLSLLRAYHASVLLSRLPAETSRGEFAGQLARALDREEELIVSEEFFFKLQQHFSEIGKVQVRLKATDDRNELTRFRYDVLLFLKDEGTSPQPPAPTVSWEEWRADTHTAERLREMLRSRGEKAWGVRRIPNARLRVERQLLAWLESTEGPQTIEAFIDGNRATAEDSAACDPAALHQWAGLHGRRCLLSWADDATPGSFDACFYEPPPEQLPTAEPRDAQPLRAGTWEQFFNQPFKAKYYARLAPALREHAAKKLPEYMVPSQFVLMERLPLTPSGKLDRRNLPPPDALDEKERDDFKAPQTAVEKRLAEIWAEVLGVARVGLASNFFQLGGHSLLATQLVTKVRSALSVDLPLRLLFEHPTLSAFCSALENLLPLDNAQRPQITRAPRAASLPLSFAQQRLWFLDQLEGPSATYNIAAALDLSGELQVGALEESLAEIVRRHEILRTVYLLENDEPVQRVMPAGGVSLKLEDISAMSPEEREAELQRLLSVAAGEPFDLKHGSIVRALLVRRSAEQHTLLIVVHHIACDGWSLGNVTRELATLYDGFAAGRPRALAELPVQYADYAFWQRQHLPEAELARQLEFWRERLTGAPPLLDLPTDRARPPVQTYRGRHLTFALDATLSRRLQALAERTGSTLYMLLLTGFVLVLSRYSGQSEFVVGTPVANRPHEELDALVGFFVNTLALRVDLSGEPRLLKLLDRVKSTVLDALARQDVPFDMVVQHLKPARSLSHAPLFQVMFALQNLPVERLELAGLTVEARPFQTEAAKFDISMIIEQAGQDLSGVIEYNTDLFDLSTIERLSGHFINALERIVDDESARVSRLNILTDAERQQLLVRWNDTACVYPRDAYVHRLFEAQAALTPEAVALEFEDERLSYRELNRRANQLAHHLRGLGIGPEARVGVCLERSTEMIVALLGILKAGGAYLPLDPSYPQERLSFMLEDAGAAALLTQARTARTLPVEGAPTIRLDADWPEIARNGAENPAAALDASNAAYLIYTSGSTGRPKGVLVEHRNLLNSTLARFSYYAEPVGRFLLLSSFAFDSSVAGIFWTLCQGGTLLLVPEGRQQETRRLVDLIEARGVSHLLCLPSLYELLLEPANAARLGALKSVIVAGEACREDLVSEHFRLLPATTLDNEYGPTEATVWSTVYRARPEEQCRRVPIGRPINNARVYILDRQMQPTPTGAPGELYVGGAGIARGYLHRPALSAEKFLPDPFGAQPGARLYRTGDLARYLADGRIEFLGRVDSQVKLRGFRIELDEVETILNEHLDVQQAALLCVEDEPGKAHLSACLIPAPGAAASVSELRRHLGERLPAYMIPSTFTFLDALPLLPNGKVDRRALGPLARGVDQAEREFEPPRTPVEEELGRIWNRILGPAPVGRDDNFFELGGHSLLAMKLMAEIEKRFGAALPVATLFRAGTIAGLAAELESSAPERTRSALVPIQEHGGLPALFFVHDISGQVLSYYPLAARLKSECSVFALQSRPSDEAGALPSLSAIAADYVREIQSARPRGPRILAGHSYGAIVAFEMAAQLERQGQAAACLLILDAVAPISKAWAFEFPDDEVGLLVYAVRTLAQSAEREVSLRPEELEPLGSEERFALALARMQERQLLPASTGTRQLAEMFGMYRANVNSLKDYRPGLIHAPIYLWSASRRPVTSDESSYRDWAKLTTGPVTMLEAEGDHVSMLKEPQVSTLAGQLQSILSRYKTGEI